VFKGPCHKMASTSYCEQRISINILCDPLSLLIHVNFGPCHHGMALPQFAAGDRLQIWRADANILTEQSRTSDKGWSSSLGGWARV
jgi:hypothetical protein